jgi:GNAT superfamily N-acetyltransferase
MPAPTSTLHLTDDPAAFLSDAKGYLAADPVVTTVIATVSARLALGAGREAPYLWWALAREGGAEGEVVGVAMRTAPFPPYPLYVLPMPDEAAVALARLLHERGEQVGGVNGALPAARVLAEESARLAGGSVVVHEHLRLFELGTLSMPPAPHGRLRLATPDDAELCLTWFRDFEAAAAEQAGRTGTLGVGESFTLDDLLGRIADGMIWLWEDASGAAVHLTGANVPAHGVTRIGPVYTPREHRGRGYAGRAVAEVSRQFLDRGVRCCLFTDQANPVSNRLYEGLGYRPVVDMVNQLLG